jgi:hypothetical protein
MVQKISDKLWKDETGREVPVEYVSSGTRLKEKNSAILLREAEILNKRLVRFKSQMELISQAVYAKAMEEFKASPATKGNYTWYNFDRSIKIEVSIAERIQFDDLAIEAAKSKLDAFLDANVTTKAEFVKELITDAFSTSHGKIDVKKIMALLKYRNKITDNGFREACDILTEGIRRPGSRRYFRIWKRVDTESYQLIDLNFSSIQ